MGQIKICEFSKAFEDLQILMSDLQTTELLLMERIFLETS